MRAFADNAQFEVKWWPFELNSNGSKEGVNKLEHYMNKFHCSKDQILQRMEGMKRTFANAGLPFNFSEAGVTGNTFNSHRLISLAGSISEETQDKVAEALFHAYFAEEKFLNDPKVLIEAAVQGGIEPEVAKRFVENEEEHREETLEELRYGQQHRVTGVPHFIIEADGQRVAVGGAQPPEVFEQVFQDLSK